MEWISVKDRLPESGDFCDIYIKGKGRVTDLDYEGDGVFYNSEFDHTYVLGDHPITHYCIVTYPQEVQQGK